jgi:tRNA U54 and U55 pseudouridine synthase Pus10
MAAAKREGTNELSGEHLKRYLDEIDKADDKLIALKVEHMRLCKGPRGKISSIMKEARETVENIEAFRTVVAAHRAERKIEARIEELEADDRADYDKMEEALGTLADTELGQAALSKAKPRNQDSSDKLDALT